MPPVTLFALAVAQPQEGHPSHRPCPLARPSPFMQNRFCTAPRPRWIISLSNQSPLPPLPCPPRGRSRGRSSPLLISSAWVEAHELNTLQKVGWCAFTKSRNRARHQQRLHCRGQRQTAPNPNRQRTGNDFTRKSSINRNCLLILPVPLYSLPF